MKQTIISTAGNVVPYREDWVPLLMGLVLYFISFPPFHIFIPSFVCLVPGIILILRAETDPHPYRRSLVTGVWYGLLTGGTLHYWVAVTLWRLEPVRISFFPVFLAAFGIFGGLLFGLVTWTRMFTKLSIVIVFPVFWTAIEWLQGHLSILAFPWLGLGTSLTGFLLPIQIADVVGARGITLMLAAANGTLALAWVRRRDMRTSLIMVERVALVLLIVLAYGFFRTRSLQLRPVGSVAMIQPNVSFDQRWNPLLTDSAFMRALTLSKQAVEKTDADLVIWPENSIPGFLGQYPDWESLITDHLRRTSVPLLAGGVDVHAHDSGPLVFHNAAYYWDSSGRRGVQLPYYKRRLAVVFERFGGIEPGISGSLFDTPLGTAGTTICFESAFEDLSRQYRSSGADLLVNISNDAWLDGTTGVGQHTAHLTMRAIENRFGIVQAANTGTSVIVDPIGRSSGQITPGVAGFSAGEVVTSGATTIHTKLGDWVGLLAILAGSFYVVWAFAISLQRRRDVVAR